MDESSITHARAKKSVKDRVSEACEIHANLRKIGALQSETNRKEISRAGNAFICKGDSETLKLRVESGVFAKVVYTARANKPSGVSLTR